MTTPAPTGSLATWSPQAALGLTCTSCHPEYRDDTSPIRLDACTETIPGGCEEAWHPGATHEIADPTAALRTAAPAAGDRGLDDTPEPTEVDP
jgi:hypothetical protein